MSTLLTVQISSVFQNLAQLPYQAMAWSDLALGPLSTFGKYLWNE